MNIHFHLSLLTTIFSTLVILFTNGNREFGEDYFIEEKSTRAITCSG
jgi:hypothetical protein